MEYFEIQQLRKNFNDFTVEFSANVQKNKMLCILGHSGSGKSTVLRMIAGLLESGNDSKIFLDGVNLSKIPAGKRSIGMVFQNSCLFSHLKVVDNACYALVSKGISKHKARKIATEWLEKFNLSGFENRYPDTLSGGEAQRVSLVRTLIAEPKVVLFDEPFSALDAPLKKKLATDLKDWQQRIGFTGIMVTHDIEEAKKLADYVTVMQKGKQVWNGKPEDFSEDLL